MLREILEVEGYIPNPVEDLCCSIGLHIFASCHHDETHTQDEDHQREALWSTPDIENLCQWKLEDAANETRHDRSRSCQRVLFEGAGDIGC